MTGTHANHSHPEAEEREPLLTPTGAELLTGLYGAGAAISAQITLANQSGRFLVATKLNQALLIVNECRDTLRGGKHGATTGA